MVLDERCTQIITILLNANGYTSVEMITNQIGISKRTFYYDIQKINKWLEGNKLQPVKKDHGKGFYLEQEGKEKTPKLISKLNKFQYFYSPEERITLIAVKLLTNRHPIFLEDIMELTQVSRATASNDLKVLKKVFTEQQLKLGFYRNSGYEIKGTEQNKRQVLVTYFAELMTSKKNLNYLLEHIKLPFFQNRFGIEGINFQLNSIKPLIEECEVQLSIELTDEMVHLLSIKLLVVIQRLLYGNRITIDYAEQEALQSTKEYSAAKNIAQRLETTYNIIVPDSEICFITMNLLGSKINYFDLNSSESVEMKKLKQTVKGIIQDFQNYACVLFKNSSQVEESLFKHLKPAYYRIKYQVSLKDENTEHVKQEFPEIFQLTKKSINQLELLVGSSINDSEIAYVAMHFGGWLQREGKKPIQRKKAIIVCENGLGTSNILWGQIEKIVTTVDIIGCISKRQYENKNCDADVVFATSVIKDKRHPVLIVNPILTDKDKEAVLSFVNNQHISGQTVKPPSLSTIMNIVKKHTTIMNEKELTQELSLLFDMNHRYNKMEEKPVLNELLTKETIQYKSEVTDWKDAIKVASEPLLTNRYITEEYVQAMIANVENLGPYVVIAPEIALPHARPQDGVNKIGMSLLRLGKSVYFSEKEKHRAKLIVVLAAVDNEKHLRALSQLTTMLSDQAVLQNVMSAESVEEILTYINQYSTI
ncbi:BglG family transcription antiterminator [Halalkalibacter flavus]|uniref:BglG family transcription antiterminator n=1 Tax=Halalkalibacter flavus TaxID=3090668 RepID=UPI002FC96BC3